MRGPDFSEVLERACRSAGIELDDGVLGPRSRFAQSTATRLQRFADRILDLGSRAGQTAASLDSYFEQLEHAFPVHSASARRTVTQRPGAG